MPRLTLEEKAEKKFPLWGGESEKEKRSILAMRKAWVDLEKIKSEKKARQKRQEERESLALGKALLKEIPYLTLRDIPDINRAYDLMFRLDRIVEGGYWSDGRWNWTTSSPKEMYELLKDAKGEEVPRDLSYLFID